VLIRNTRKDRRKAQRSMFVAAAKVGPSIRSLYAIVTCQQLKMDGQVVQYHDLCINAPQNSTTKCLTAEGIIINMTDPKLSWITLFRRYRKYQVETGFWFGGGSFSVSCAERAEVPNYLQAVTDRQRYPRSPLPQTHASTDPNHQPSSAYRAARVGHPPGLRAG
jgi:hypothetical protein